MRLVDTKSSQKTKKHPTKNCIRLNVALKNHQTPYKVKTDGHQGKTVDFTASGTVTLPSGEPAPANGLLAWEIPGEIPPDWPQTTAQPLADFWDARIKRQQEIDASIAAKADREYPYDKPYEAQNTVRVAGPFTVESLSPHRTLTVGADSGKLLNARPNEKARG